MALCKICGNEYEGEKCPHCGYADSEEVRQQCLKPGAMLEDGRYVVGNVIGVGGFGITYSAWDKKLQIKVAIKEYLPGECATRMANSLQVTVYGGDKERQYADGLEKFYEEGQRLAKFREVQGIVQIFEVLRENGTAYLIMEYLDGETLGERIKREGKLPVAEAVDIMIHVLTAMEAVHQKGMIHRDIAPNNIFLCKDGTVKLIDFGAARISSANNSKSLTVLYKEGFTAEEQYRSDGQQGAWTDVYSAAATLYKAITGITPEGALERKIKDNLKLPSKTGVKVPANVDVAIMNALNVNADGRTRSAEAFREELQKESGVKKHYERTQEVKVGRIPKGVWITACVFLGILAVILGLYFTGVIHFYPETFDNLFMAKGKVRVMNVVNMEEGEATERLKGIDLNLEIIKYKYSDRLQPGIVVSQEEKKGEVVDAGSSIHVVVTKNAEKVKIPDIDGVKWETFQKQLEELGLEYEMTMQPTMTFPDYVLECEPKAGTETLQGETVKVTVSAGLSYEEGSRYTVEDLRGKSEDEAREQLAKNGIYMLVGDSLYDDEITKDLVASQDVAVGNTIDAGSVITIGLSLGIEMKTVPDLVGKSQEEAQELLDALQLKYQVVTKVTADAEDGEVLEQSIEADTVVEKYTELQLTVAEKGYVIPSLTGKTRAEAEEICRQSGYTVKVTEVLGTEGKVVGQNPSANEMLETPQAITIQVGITNDTFIANLLAAINAKRAQSGMGELHTNEALRSVAEQLENSGHESVEFTRGYDYSWALDPIYNSGAQGGDIFWASRQKVTSVTELMTRLPMTASALMNSAYDKIGIYVSGSDITIMVGILFY